MPIESKFYLEHTLVITNFSNGVTDDEIIPFYRALYESPEWEPGLRELADLRGADLSRVSTDCLKDLIRLVQTYMKGPDEGSKSAVIAPNDLPFALARYYESASENSPEQVEVFRSKGEALSWLEIKEDLLD